MTSLQDHYCTVFTPFHFFPESNHVFYGAAADKMTEGDVICILEILSRALLWQTTGTVSSLNEENRHELKILYNGFGQCCMLELQRLYVTNHISNVNVSMYLLVFSVAFDWLQHVQDYSHAYNSIQSTKISKTNWNITLSQIRLPCVHPPHSLVCSGPIWLW